MPARESIEIVEEALDAAAGRRLMRDYVAEITALYPDWTPEVPPRMTAEDVI